MLDCVLECACIDLCVTFILTISPTISAYSEWVSTLTCINSNRTLWSPAKKLCKRCCRVTRHGYKSEFACWLWRSNWNKLKSNMVIYYSIRFSWCRLILCTPSTYCKNESFSCRRKAQQTYLIDLQMFLKSTNETLFMNISQRQHLTWPVSSSWKRQGESMHYEG